MDSNSRSEECSNVDLGDVGYCMLAATVLALEVDSCSSCLFVAKVAVVAAAAAGRSWRCMEVVGRAEPVGVVGSSVSLGSSLELPFFCVDVASKRVSIRWSRLQCKYI